VWGPFELLPGDLSEGDVTAYRYALFYPRPHVLGRFLVALDTKGRGFGPNAVSATMPVGAALLRHEQESGVVSKGDLQRVHIAVDSDLRRTIRTHQL
jgi:hypothetical protein